MIVVDTNVLIYRWFPSRYEQNVERLVAVDTDWVAPLLWRSEFRNVLCQYLKRDQLSFVHAMAVLEKAEEAMANREYDVDSVAVMELAESSGCTAYDCEFIALASDLRTSLITTDTQLLKAFPSIAKPLGGF